MLLKYGFSKVALTKFDKEFSPGELQVEAWKGSTASVRVSKSNSCLVIRDGALGDVILTTPIVERLRDDYAAIDVMTKCPQVYEKNPHIRSILRPSDDKSLYSGYGKVIDLNNAYELNPERHIVDAYSLKAFSDVSTPYHTQLYGLDGGKMVTQNYVVIHASVGWENRTWPEAAWYEVVAHLRGRGETIYLIGAGNDRSLISADKNLVGAQTFWEMAKTIAEAKAFIGFDSGPLHVAEAYKILRYLQSVEFG